MTENSTAITIEIWRLLIRCKEMTQDERWSIRYNEVMEFISSNHRNPSKYNLEERNMYNFIKHIRKQMNQGLLKEERIEVFRKLLEMMEENKHVNQYK
jgi:predicted DNA-binding protein (UPF0278 family)